MITKEEQSVLPDAILELVRIDPDKWAVQAKFYAKNIIVKNQSIADAITKPESRTVVIGDDLFLARVFDCPHRSCRKCGRVDCLGGKRDGSRVTLDDCLSCLDGG
mgnify:CR=1 FL=1